MASAISNFFKCFTRRLNSGITSTSITTSNLASNTASGSLLDILKSDLRPKQVKAASKMHSLGLQLPSYWLKHQPIPAIPKPGALPGHTVSLRKTGGRNHHGKITVRHRGGGFRRRIRLLDTKRQNLPASEGWRIVRLEHDPNRSAQIALTRNKAGEMRYVLATQSMTPGAILSNDQAVDGATLSLKEIPLGSAIHNIECIPGRGGQLVRAAGTFATLVGKDLDGVRGSIRLPSGSIKKLLLGCRATVGRVGNAEWQNRVLGSAGKVRRLGRRPKVRGVAMNAVDHPHGGGKGGRGKGKPSQSIWGWTCK